MRANQSPEVKKPRDTVIQEQFESHLNKDGSELFRGAHRIGRIVGDKFLTPMHVTLATMNHDHPPLAAVMRAADLHTGYVEKDILKIDLDTAPPGPADTRLPYSGKLLSLAERMINSLPVPINRKKTRPTPSIGSMDILRDIVLEEEASIDFVLGFTETAANASQDRLQIMWDAVNLPKDSGQKTA